MKQCALIVACIFIIFASLYTVAESSESLFTLWDIPFGYAAKDVASRLSLDRSITFDRVTHFKTDLTPQYTSIHSTSDLTLYGLPCRLSYDDYTYTFELEFIIPGSWSDRTAAVDKITDALIEKYGTPDFLTFVQSDGTIQTAVPANGEELAYDPTGGSVFLIRIHNITLTAQYEDQTDDGITSIDLLFHPSILPIKGEQNYDTF